MKKTIAFGIFTLLITVGCVAAQKHLDDLVTVGQEVQPIAVAAAPATNGLAPLIVLGLTNLASIAAAVNRAHVAGMLASQVNGK